MHLAAAFPACLPGVRPASLPGSNGSCRHRPGTPRLAAETCACLPQAPAEHRRHDRLPELFRHRLLLPSRDADADGRAAPPGCRELQYVHRHRLTCCTASGFAAQRNRKPLTPPTSSPGGPTSALAQVISRSASCTAVRAAAVPDRLLSSVGCGQRIPPNRGRPAAWPRSKVREWAGQR